MGGPVCYVSRVRLLVCARRVLRPRLGLLSISNSSRLEAPAITEAAAVPLDAVRLRCCDGDWAGTADDWSWRLLPAGWCNALRCTAATTCSGLSDDLFLELTTLADVGLHGSTRLVLPGVRNLPAELMTPRAPFALGVGG